MTTVGSFREMESPIYRALLDDSDDIIYSADLPRPAASVNEEISEDEVSETTSALASSTVRENQKLVNEERGKSLGEKEIGSWLSIIFIVNQIYGPGVLSIPIVFQQAGWVVVVLALTFFLVVSALASTLVCDAITMIPGNKNYERRIEFTTAVQYYFGRKWHLVFQLFLNITLQVYNIASIVVCAQSLDAFFVFIFKKTWALELWPHFGFHAFSDADTLYSSALLAISVGYVAICVLVIPMGFLNLEKNVKVVQTGSFIFLAILLGEFIVQFCLQGPKMSAVPAFGDQYAQVASVFIFTWAYPMFVPSWANEKKDHVSVNKTIWISGIASWIGYLGIGLLCAMANPGVASDDMLGFMATDQFPIVTIVATYLFALGVIAPGIPVCSITIRYNLFIGKVCGKWSSYFWGVISPWLISFVFCRGELFADLLNWSSLVFNGIVNFLVPLILYWVACRSRPADWKSGVRPYPKRIRGHARTITMVLFVITLVVVVAQIIVDLYYRLALNEDMLSS
eukprot:TRINITY_DN11864_c0_g1_i1.p1 TRINITY_DN11864_c0_g1~~TRINITY_DN11864_c0_g1_i1.p1  ORF type:complete len:512 (+),score=139.81 TRINITY_DN11864_c0_g1_i1:206-1741(+)